MEAMRIFDVAKPPLPELYRQFAADEYDIIYETRPALLELRAVFAPSNLLTSDEAALLAAAPNGHKRLDRLRRLSRRTPQAPGRTTRRPPIWEPCAIICWMIVRDACIAAGRVAGAGKDAVAVKVAVRACRRIGFRGAAEGALALRLKVHGFKAVYP
jgi:hypothetical protein